MAIEKPTPVPADEPRHLAARVAQLEAENSQLRAERDRLSQGALAHGQAAGADDLASLRQHAARLARANEELLHFAFAVSHDLQEPLRTISGFSQLLARKYQGKLDEQADQFVDWIVTAGARMSTMITDLLRLAEVAGGPLNSQNLIPLDEVLATSLLNLRTGIEEAGAAITHDPLPRVAADPAQLIQVFQNLIGNSLKYRKPDAPPEIHISCECRAGESVITIRDNGIGFEQGQSERIFGVFQRLHEGEFPGTGIGLTICKRIVERAGGRIWANAQPGQGAAFSFSIPELSLPANFVAELVQPGDRSTRPALESGLAVSPDDRASELFEAHFDELFHTLDLAQALIRKLDGTILIWTKGAERLFGWSSKEAVGRHAHDLLQTQFPKPRSQIEVDLLRDGEWTGDLKKRRRDGSVVWLASHWSLYRDGSGRPQSVIEVNNDITALKEAEQALHHSSEQRDLALRAGPMGIWQWDMRTGAIDWSETVDQMLGLAAGSIRGSPLAALSHVYPDDLPLIRQNAVEALGRRGEFVVETRMLRADGSTCWWRAQGRVMAGEGEQPTGIVGVVWDITQRKEDESKLAAYAESLSVGVQLSGLALAQVDYLTGMTQLSGEAARLYGLGEAQMTLPREQVHTAFHPADREKLARRIAQVVDPASTGWLAMHHRVVWPDGRVRWLDVRQQVSFDDIGGRRRPVRGVIAALDITARRRHESDRQFLLNFSSRLPQMSDPDTLIERVCRSVGTYLNVSRCSFTETDLEKAQFRVVRDYHARGPSIAGIHELSAFGPLVLESLMANEPVAVEDTQSDPRTAGRYQAAYTRHFTRSFLSVPFHRQGRLVASIAVSHHEPRVWEPSEIALLREVAARVQPALENARLLQITREKQQQFESTFEQAAVGIAHVALDGRWLLVNRRLCELVGHSSAELLMLTSRDITHPEDLESDLQQFTALYSGEIGSYSIEKRFIQKTGAAIWCNLTVGLVKDSAGRPEYAVSVIQDITDRKRAEEALRESDSQLRSFIDSISQLAWIAHADGYIFWYNRRWYEYTGTTPEQMEGWGWQSVHDPAVLPSVLETWQASIRTGMPLSMEFPLRSATGVYRPFLTRVVPVRNAQGEVVRWFGTNTDVDSLRKEQEAVKESEKRFRELAESLPEIVWEADTGGKLTYFNPQWLAYTGLSPVHDMSDQARAAVHPDDAGRLVSGWENALANGGHFEIEARMRRQDGVYRWFLNRADPISDENGEPVKWLGTCTDIHEQKSTEEALRRSNEDLEQFAYAASHDLQEPLRMVSIYTEMLAKRYQGEGEEAERFVGVVLDSVKRMFALLQGILEYSRAADHTELGVSSDSEAALVRSLEALKISIGESGAVITHEPLPAVMCSQVHLQQLFQNFIGNAIKYRGERSPAIHVSSSQNASSITFAVRDNGIGIRREYSHQIFGMFKRLHKDEYPGAGIGLAVCKRIVERYGGGIWLDSAVGCGTTFYFSLPAPPA